MIDVSGVRSSCETTATKSSQQPDELVGAGSVVAVDASGAALQLEQPAEQDDDDPGGDGAGDQRVAGARIRDVGRVGLTRDLVTDHGLEAAL